MEQALKITEEIRQELTDSNITICTYMLEDNTEADCIDLFYLAQYPNLEIVNVQPYKITIPTI